PPLSLASLFFFLSHPPPPPPSTLFPYTTLFRSAREGLTASDAALDGRQGYVAAFSGATLPDDALDRLGSRWELTASGIAVKPYPDRKSTRLNSSHRTISYAVFCLKKKKKKKEYD